MSLNSVLDSISNDAEKSIRPGSGKPTRTNDSCDYCAARDVVAEYLPTEAARHISEIMDRSYIGSRFVAMCYGIAKVHDRVPYRCEQELRS